MFLIPPWPQQHRAHGRTATRRNEKPNRSNSSKKLTLLQCLLFLTGRRAHRPTSTERVENLSTRVLLAPPVAPLSIPDQSRSLQQASSLRSYPTW